MPMSEGKIERLEREAKRHVPHRDPSKALAEARRRWSELSKWAQDILATDKEMAAKPLLRALAQIIEDDPGELATLPKCCEQELVEETDWYLTLQGSTAIPAV